MTRYWNRNLISSTERLPTSSATSGIYDLVSQKVYKQANLWPATTPSVVTEDVEVFLDAGDSSSYGGTGTTWSDLSGNNNDGTLTNMDAANYSSSDGGYFTFDGSNEYVDVSGSTTVSAATFLAWVRLDDLSQTSYTGIVFSRSTNGTSGMNFYSTTENVGYHWNNASNAFGWNSGLTLPSQEWCMIAVTVTSSVATGYLFRSSGTTSATNSVTHGSATLDAVKVGADVSTNRYLDGRISVAMVYSRALSSAELTQNFNAFKGRYGY